LPLGLVIKQVSGSISSTKTGGEIHQRYVYLWQALGENIRHMIPFKEIQENVNISVSDSNMFIKMCVSKKFKFLKELIERANVPSPLLVR